MNDKTAISENFLIAFSRLPRPLQGKITELLTRMRSSPLSPDLRYEPVPGCGDPGICAIPVEEDCCCIAARQPETGISLLLWVDRREPALAWARCRRCDVNPRTGTIQVYEVQDSPAEPEGPVSIGLFTGVPDEDLLKLGVPAAQLPLIRSLASREQLRAASTSLPQETFEALSWLAEGFPTDEVAELIFGPDVNASSGESENDLGQALQRPETLRSFVVVEGEEELRRIMAAPLETWRVFLHPRQYRIVNRDYNGPARVLGGAGTGKTVVAMHRARVLASKLGPGQRILFTTFTANLAADIKENLRKICSAEELSHIDVINLDAWVRQYLKESGFNAEIRYDERISELWQDAVHEAGADLPYPASFYEDEWNRVAMPQEALTLKDYLKARRTGRGTPLNRKARMEVWKVFECYQDLYKERHVRDGNMALYECSRLLLREGRTRYTHVIADEGQDFSDSAFRLLRILAGEQHKNDIFITGDTHQRIYRNHPVLSRCGIQVRGRSSILRLNYRTTEEIRKFAMEKLTGCEFDDMDEAPDAGDGCRSLMHGEIPQVRKFRDAAGEFDFLVDEIRRLKDNQVPLQDICVVARTKKLVENYAAMFTRAGIPSFLIRRSKADNRRMDGLRLATMHRVKGLEFQYVFVCAANQNILPLKGAINETDPIAKEETLTAEKCLLYVALTRARRGAWITSYGKPSEFL